jgi:hypothetical protein
MKAPFGGRVALPTTIIEASLFDLEFSSAWYGLHATEVHQSTFYSAANKLDWIWVLLSVIGSTCYWGIYTPRGIYTSAPLLAPSLVFTHRRFA